MSMADITSSDSPTRRTTSFDPDMDQREQPKPIRESAPCF